MRITTRAMSMTVLQNLSELKRNITKLDTDLTTGVTVRQASDGPTKAALAMRIFSSLEQNERYKTTVDSATSWLVANDAALGQMGDILTDIRTLLLQGKTGSNPDAAKGAVADQIEEFRNHLLTIANQEHQGSYIFGGQATDKPPYEIDADGNVTFVGNTTRLSREISPNQRLEISMTEDELDLTNIFTELNTIITGLRSDDGSVDLDEKLGVLTTKIDHLIARRSEVGAKMNRLELLQARFLDAKVNLEALQAETIGTDMERTTIDLAIQDAAYNTALAVAGRILPRSLVDYLR